MAAVPTSRSFSLSSLALFRDPAKRRLLCCLLLALSTMALYNPVTRAPFLNYDDSVNVTDNLPIRAGLTWKTVAWAFHTSDTLDWHPISWLSYALDCQIFGLTRRGLNPTGFHTVNVLFHATDAVLLFLILESATAFAWRSFAVAALFALHPLNVESVAWISERKNVLSMFFFLIALAAYGWYARRPSVARYAAVTLAYALALMSKAQVITFPFALLLLDYWPLCRFPPTVAVADESALLPPRVTFWKLVLEKVAWLALSGVSAILTTRGGRAFNYTTQIVSFPWWIRLGNAAISYVQYMEKAFWPIHLALVYPHPGFAIRRSAILLSTVAIFVFTTLVVVFRRYRPLFVGWFWFLGTMVPMTGLVPIGPHAMADRYAYIPLLGIFVVVCWGAADLSDRFRLPAAIPATCAIAVLSLLAIALHRQVSFWQSNVALWTHTLEITGPNFVAEENLALALIDDNRAQQAFPHLQRAQMLQPGDPLAALNLATFQQMRGNYPAALDGFATVVRFAGTASALRATAEANAGYAHLSLKQYREARQDFESALLDQPGNSPAYRGLGLLAQRAGDIALAAGDYRRSVELQPSPVGFLLLAQALAVAKQEEDARAAESQAVAMSQDLNGDIAVVRQLLAN